MRNIDWVRKLSSRKFWALLGGQATAILTALNAGEQVTLQVAAVIASIGTIVMYILSEARVDAARSKEE